MALSGHPADCPCRLGLSDLVVRVRSQNIGVSAAKITSPPSVTSPVIACAGVPGRDHLDQEMRSNATMRQSASRGVSTRNRLMGRFVLPVPWPAPDHQSCGPDSINAQAARMEHARSAAQAYLSVANAINRAQRVPDRKSKGSETRSNGCSACGTCANAKEVIEAKRLFNEGSRSIRSAHH
jgi:hypothetical protein